MTEGNISVDLSYNNDIGEHYWKCPIFLIVITKVKLESNHSNGIGLFVNGVNNNNSNLFQTTVHMAKKN